MKIGGNVASVVVVLMAASSLFLMVCLLQIDRTVHHDLYLYGLQFSYQWARPYWIMVRAAFALAWFNIIAAITVQLYTVTFRRREVEQLVADVAKELRKIEARPKESGRPTLPDTRELMKLFATATRSTRQEQITSQTEIEGDLKEVTIEVQQQPAEVAEPQGQISDRGGHILRVLPRDKAFYFYEGLGKPTGEFAESLLDFRDKIMTLQLSSLIYHMERNDIENWIEEVVGDPTLAERIRKLVPHDLLKMELRGIIETRIIELTEMRRNQPDTSEEHLVAYPNVS